MNIMPRINFCSSMILLSPPAGNWNSLHSAINKFIWNNKPPRIRLAILQRSKNTGGQNVPNLKFYFWSFTMRALSTWLSSEVTNSWHAIEEARVKPHRLKDVVHSNIPRKISLVKFGFIIAHLILVWQSID